MSIDEAERKQDEFDASLSAYTSKRGKNILRQK